MNRQNPSQLNQQKKSFSIFNMKRMKRKTAMNIKLEKPRKNNGKPNRENLKQWFKKREFFSVVFLSVGNRIYTLLILSYVWWRFSAGKCAIWLMERHPIFLPTVLSRKIHSE
jgi:hypothetical protein